MKFGEKVRAARLAAKYSQKQLAEMTGIALRTIQNYESGERMPKQKETYPLLADALGIEVSSLMDDNADFVLKATEKYGSKGHEQAERLIKEVSGLYAGGELAEEDMEAMMRAFQEAYWKAKEKNRKYVPKKYRGISESGSEGSLKRGRNRQCDAHWVK